LEVGLCPPPVFVEKSQPEKNPGEKEAIPWGSDWMNSDHHPKAVILSSGRACPGQIHKEEWFSPVLPPELFARRPLFAEDRQKGE
jgi:hypothetical protein